MEELLAPAATLLGLGGERFKPLPHRGVGALTWMSDRWVVQRRPAWQLDRFELSIKVAAELSGDDHFLGLRPKPFAIYERSGSLSSELPGELDVDGFWSAQPRVQGYAPSTQENSPAELADYGRRSLDDVALQIARLSKVEIPLEAFSVAVPRPLALLLIETPWLVAYAQRAFEADVSRVFLELGPEPESEIVLCHGDPILKNTVISDQGSYLIDWEYLSPLPIHRELTHIAAYLFIRCLDTGQSAELAELVLLAGQRHGLIADFDKESWRLALSWHLLRELSLQPPGALNEKRARAVAAYAADGFPA